MTLDSKAVAAWLDAYLRAWESNDPEAIGTLFSDNATYAYHPWDTEPLRGRAAIVAGWLEHQDAPGSYAASFEPLAIDGDLAVATGRTQYFSSTGAVERDYYNCWVMRFDDRGQCSAFTEWFMQAPTA